LPETDGHKIYFFKTANEMNHSNRSLSHSINLRLLKLVTASWQSLFNVEKILKRKIFIQEFDAREDDICVVTYMRSGTTLVQMMLYQLLTDGNMNFRHLADISPLLEDAISTGTTLQKLPSPRFFKTHGDYKYFPRKLNARIIYVVRNGMDVASSVYHYYKDYTMPDLDWNKFLDKNFMGRNNWFRHTEDWLENKNGFNIHYIKYEDITRNMRKVAEDLAAFLQIRPSGEVLQRVLDRCSFQYMKEYETKFGRPKIATNKTDQYFIRKGQSGTGQLEFDSRQREKFISLYEKHLARFDLGYDYSQNKTAAIPALH